MRYAFQLVVFFIVGLLSAGILVSAQSDDNPFGDANIEDKRPRPKPEEFRVTMTKKDCARIINDTTSSDVAYQSGVDAHGNAVAPADLPGSQMQLDIPDDISFDLTLNPFEYSGNADLAETFSNSSTNLGTIKYSITSGKMTLNGKNLTDDQLEIIAKSCKAQGILK